MNKKQRMRNRETAYRLYARNNGLSSPFCPLCLTSLKFDQSHYRNGSYSCAKQPALRKQIEFCENLVGYRQDQYQLLPMPLYGTAKLDLEDELFRELVGRNSGFDDAWDLSRIFASYCLAAPEVMAAGSCRYPDDVSYGHVVEQTTFRREKEAPRE